MLLPFTVSNVIQYPNTSSLPNPKVPWIVVPLFLRYGFSHRLLSFGPDVFEPRCRVCGPKAMRCQSEQTFEASRAVLLARIYSFAEITFFTSGF